MIYIFNCGETPRKNKNPSKTLKSLFKFVAYWGTNQKILILWKQLLFIRH